VSISRFARSVAEHVKKGAKSVMDDVYNRRLKECNSCGHKIGIRCRVCGCFVKVKAKWAEQECPEGKWKAEI